MRPIPKFALNFLELDRLSLVLRAFENSSWGAAKNLEIREKKGKNSIWEKTLVQSGNWTHDLLGSSRVQSDALPTDPLSQR